MPLNRRWVIAAGSAACFAGLSRSALAETLRRAAASGLPLLSEASLNAMIPSPEEPDYAEVLGEAARDIRSFLRAHFTLTAGQDEAIGTISDGSRRLAGALLKRSAKGRWRVSVRVGEMIDEVRRREDELRKKSKEAENGAKFVRIMGTAPAQSGEQPKTTVVEFRLGAPPPKPPPEEPSSSSSSTDSGPEPPDID